MKAEKRSARQQQIEEAAYELLVAHGYDATSMLAVAKAAKASNETLYRWYGDKNGMFLSMVRANALVVREALQAAARTADTPLDVLRDVAPVLLSMLLADKSIALNRAAAADPTGTLGRAIAQGGRDEVLPLLENLMIDAVQQGQLSLPDDGEIGALFMHLLVGDQQVRRIIGTLAAPTKEAVAGQARRALAQFETLCAPDRQ